MPLNDPRTVLPSTLELRLETVEGIVSRAGRFFAQPGGSFVADRWVSAIFNARENSGPAATAPAPSDQNGATGEDGRIPLWLETVTGFYPNRGGGFSLRPDDGTWLGDRWVSAYRDVRLG